MSQQRKQKVNYDPSQYGLYSGSAAIDYLKDRDKEPTGLSFLPSFFPPLDQKGSFEPNYDSEKIALNDTSFTEKISDNIKKTSQRYVPIFIQRQAVTNRFIALQKWEGIVLQVNNDSMIARLLDLTNDGSDGEAEFNLSEIHSDDLPLVKIGALFYWNIGYMDKKGQRIRASIIRFKRIPNWRKDELEIAKKDAEHTSKLFKWDSLD
jgi:hypothetical protein